ncbi:glycosyltransferase [Boseongicola aestuarii]|uniref:L-noviosyl transferase n=1 Tax=Boseongicola aestuarii TaxID=1470561 RepID=A0A238J6A1_9RHOB|nr:glycosyltransferase [Boseongicola aestuarii]SMX25414.1 L-noviosyl transferase [Boseongicola aestuarii]
MRILFTSTKGEGHIRPLLPYARAAAGLGHDVQIAAPEPCAPIIAKAGFRHHVFECLSGPELEAIWGPHRGVRDDDMVKIAIPQMFAGATAERSMPGLRQAVETWRPDVIVRESVEYAGLVVAEAYGIPHARVNVHNCGFEELVNSYAVEPVATLLEGVGAAGDSKAMIWEEPVFTAFPETFDGDAQAGENNPPMRVSTASSGPVPETDWTPKGERPLVYMTFGTVAAGFGQKGHLYQLVLDALAQTDTEILLTVGPNFDISSLENVPGNVDVRSFVPQAAVFPHAAAILCHGGSGTLLGGFGAGLPQVVTPLFADQFDNARRAERAGLGLMVSDPIEEGVADAVTEIMKNQDIAERCALVAAEMASLVPSDVAAERMVGLARGG